MAIRAKALGIPAVVACRGALGIEDRTTVSVDGTTGAVTVVPAEEVAAIQQRADDDRRLLASATGPGQMLDPWQPPLLQLIAMCAAAGRDVDKSVSVCGEAASDPLLAPVLVGMGITSLSMSASAVPAVRVALARRTREECENLARLALAAPDAMAGRRAVADRSH